MTGVLILNNERISGSKTALGLPGWVQWYHMRTRFVLRIGGVEYIQYDT